MQVSEHTLATLLLTAWFGKRDEAGPTPLTPTEWGRFALYLMDIGRKPGDLLHVSDSGELLAGLNDKTITLRRVRALLERSAALGIALEKWQRSGLWVMTRSDPDYPIRWKRRLKNDAPPVLFGAGNRDLLNRGGIAVVGSRDLDASQVSFTGKLGQDIAYQGLTVISGGARGADEAAMLGSLESEGMAVGVLADSLLRSCTSVKYRRALMSNDLVLVSPFNPEAGFNVGNAMARNKYIYCLSDAAIVIAATENKGGTWSGAIEDLKNDWVPLWVLRGAAPGNKALVERGAQWLPDELYVQSLFESSGGMTEHVAKVGSNDSEKASSEPESSVASFPEQSDEAASIEDPYQFFVRRLCDVLGSRSLSLKELQRATLLKQKQLSEWLKRAEQDGIVVRTKSPVAYKLKLAASPERKCESVLETDKQPGFRF